MSTQIMRRVSQLNRWHTFLLKTFGIKNNFDSLAIPKERIGFNRLIVVPKGITLTLALKACRSAFDIYSAAADIETLAALNIRKPTESYAIWVRDRVEADEEFANNPANVFEGEAIPGLTLLERLLYEAKYFAESGNHLDVHNITVCSGSRGDGGVVPNVHWHRDYHEVCVGCYGPSSHSSDLRSREVVS